MGGWDVSEDTVRQVIKEERELLALERIADALEACAGPLMDLQSCIRETSRGNFFEVTTDND